MQWMINEIIAVRPGNPKDIKDWADLTQPNLNILTPNPETSGGAQWNINAIYGAALRGFAGVPKDDPAAAQGFLKDVFGNVSIMDKGARESITTFEKNRFVSMSTEAMCAMWIVCSRFPSQCGMYWTTSVGEIETCAGNR